MSQSTHARDGYQEELSRYARLLTSEQEAGGQPSLDSRTREQMRLFAEENLDKRYDKLVSQLELLAGAFPDLEELLGAYVEALPQAAYDTVLTDADRFLSWLEERKTLSAEQLDHVRCQRARHAVDALARGSRLAHVHFQERWSLVGTLGPELGHVPQLEIYLNPIRVRSRFETGVLLGEDADVPAEVIFFAAGSQVSTAVLEPEGLARLDELAALSPCSLEEWSARSRSAGREELVELCLDLAEMGLVAFG